MRRIIFSIILVMSIVLPVSMSISTPKPVSASTVHVLGGIDTWGYCRHLSQYYSPNLK
jgi:hypothetical protein